jgi:hypothetical protein
MKGKQPGIKRAVLMVFAGILLFGGSTDDLFGNSQPAPISGTPMLRHQTLQLLRDFGKGATIQAEINRGREILADYVSQQVSFWAYNFGTYQYYQTTATCKSVTGLANGTAYNLNIYSEDGKSVSTEAITNTQNEFINRILPKETTYFGSPPVGDFTILILDIQDGGGATFIAGYFDPTNEYPKSSNPSDPTYYSNTRHMIYMDLNTVQPPGTVSFYGTLAHEFQHFIHNSKDPQESIQATWVNEGLSGLARFVCGYGHPVSHVRAFAANPTTSLVTWQDNLENYGATYLFMLYLAEHYGGADTARAIVANSGIGITGINNALLQRGYAVTVNNIFKNWVIANYLNNSSISGGIYGYTDSFAGIPSAPGNFQTTNSHSTYPASGGGPVNQYAANYIKFTNLGGTYDTFILAPYNLSESNAHSYSYTGMLGSFILNLSGINDQMGMSGIQEASSSPPPVVIATLSASNTINNTSGGSSSGGGGGCFIATTAYGSPLAEEVYILREFRDRYLLTNLPGRSFVSLYYACCPLVVNLISKHDSLKILTRITLYPAVKMSYAVIKAPRNTGLLILSSSLLFGLVLIRRRRRG